MSSTRWLYDDRDALVVHEDFDSLTQLVRSWVELNGKAVIAIDGVNGIGKSTLAGELAQQLGIAHIKLDDLMRPELRNTGVFVPALNLDELQAKINSDESSVIVDGVCSLDAFARIRAQPDRLIYLRIRSAKGIFVHDAYYGDDERASQWREQLLGLSNGEGRLDLEILDYHRKFLPLKKSRCNLSATGDPVVRY